MAINLAHWKKGFRNLPPWTCPTCDAGRLLVLDKLLCKESGPSERQHSHDAWDPDWIENRFAGLLKCNLKSCGEVCSISGVGGIDFDDEFDEELGWVQVHVDYYQPRNISPSPHIFKIDSSWPAPVKAELALAFALFWSDLDSCANKLRSTVELLLTDQGVPKYTQPVKGRKRAQLNLHTRIERFKAKNQEVAELLMAIKWIGNHGSHGGEGLKREDILTSADLMEHALLKVYAAGSDAIKRAKAINKRRGPVEAKPRRKPKAP